MSTKTIPAKTIKTCDRCGVECTTGNHAKGGALHITEHALDFAGHAVASANRNYDLCDTCLQKVTAAIDASLSLNPHPMTNTTR